MEASAVGADDGQRDREAQPMARRRRIGPRAPLKDNVLEAFGNTVSVVTDLQREP